jgi:methionyl-tRNA formyltransferase
MNKFRIGFFGDGPWAHEALKRILEEPDFEVVFICVRFDTPDSFLLKQAVMNNIPALKFENVNQKENIIMMKGFHADLFVSMSFNQIFRDELLGIPAYKTINCHAGKLPFYRGRNILNWALINGEQEFGITVHLVDSGIDTGDIICQATFPISLEDDYGSLLRVAYKECAPLIVKSIISIKLGLAKPIPQNQINAFGTYFPRRRIGDELIDWNQPAQSVFNFIRALANPGPQAQTRLNHQLIKINRSIFFEQAPNFKGIPGSVIGIGREGISVKTADSFILATEFSETYKPHLGDRLT